MKTAILYICTGKYNQFFESFYASCEKFFLKNISQVEYFVFTDNMKLTKAPNVHLFYKVCEGFPKDSLFRFDMFLSIKEQLQTFDYAFFFNANMLVCAPIGEDFLPQKESLMAVIHPGFYRKPSSLYPYERNKKSTAFIPYRKGHKYVYYMGSLNGGKTLDFLQMAEVCSRNTHTDYANGIVACVHDESHLNKYMDESLCKGLSPAYAYPEGWKLPFVPQIIIRDKVRIDPYFNKGRDNSLWGKIKKAAEVLYRAVRWYV